MSALEQAPQFGSSRGDVTESDSVSTRGTVTAGTTSSENGPDSPAGLSEVRA
jgi:hypothetical protein